MLRINVVIRMWVIHATLPDCKKCTNAPSTKNGNVIPRVLQTAN